MVGEGCGEGWGCIRPVLTVFRKREDRKMLKCFAQAGRFSELFSKLSCWPFGLELYSKHFKLPFFFFGWEQIGQNAFGAVATLACKRFWKKKSSRSGFSVYGGEYCVQIRRTFHLVGAARTLLCQNIKGKHVKRHLFFLPLL